ncbi:MAG: hypothetical protein EOQ40_17410 [Mesorhizobium sp.]|uniref:hypothetical protein n=1 Tax=Mesorhizobium sp. TaxID=1871066 RepID=UPI000FEA8DAC|nr:hypothetical protein [Mesorhizobium sp.]RWB19913.1 MAG: hypothetical protein EOQ40_17410 [Mesorhizobium sp.]
MTKLSDLGPPMSGKQPDRYKARDYVNSYVCPVCHQVVDMTDLRQLVWHREPKHEALEIDE